ncbi:MAG: riboflavin biosynthesis protein RibF [Bdellovibrionaceae bacterium]|nr:riboflavin biosynthesis protein RibF [Pseudobdellovibrionaceae bacterium]
MIEPLDPMTQPRFWTARAPSEVPDSFAQSAVVLGNLDGLHRGHQALLEVAQEFGTRNAAPVVVFTFDPHPMQVLPGKPDFRRIFSPEVQTEMLRHWGASGVYYQHFDLDFAKTSAEDFLNQCLVPAVKPAAIVVGFNFRFGQGRQGTPEFLREWGSRHGVKILVVEPVNYLNETVSSSKIRAALLAGDVHHAGQLLGFPFFLQGIVEKGAQRGRNLGFPTANMMWSTSVDPVAKTTLTPAFGVYVTRTHFQGNVLPSVSHLGPIPTFSDIRPRLETHILDRDLALYGETLRVEFLEKLRDPVKFEGLDALKAQIDADCAAARRYHREHP